MTPKYDLLKVAATSLKLDIRLHAHQVGTNARSGTEVSLRSSDWLMRLELGYSARSLISGFNDVDDVATVIISSYSYSRLSLQRALI